PQVPGTTPPEHTRQVQAGLAAIAEEQKPYLKNGQILKSEAEEVAAKVKSKHPVFKSLEVVDGDKTWDYAYVASPKEKWTGPTKEEAVKMLTKYDAKLNSAGQVEGNFSDTTFDFSDYNFQTAHSPVAHPANIRYKHPLGPDIPKPSGKYTIGGATRGGPFRDRWIEMINTLRDDKKAELIRIAESPVPPAPPPPVPGPPETAETKEVMKMQRALMAMGLTTLPAYFTKQPKSLDGMAELLAQHHVRQTIEPQMPYHDIFLVNWEEHHIHPVNWGGTDDETNLIFIRHAEHHPITTWFGRRKIILETALK
ncbi:MAG: HNH endonuclease, partial [Acidobacteriota bacterium]|nr:HNH endonuclease [Acidobacteriota bacterium]